MSTKSGIRWLNGGITKVELPNGRKIELCSKEGADEFVDTVGNDFMSKNLTATNDGELCVAYFVMLAVTENASPEKIATGIPESELRTFIEQMRGTLDTLSTDRNWLRSGTVSMPYELLLQAVASFSQHHNFLKIFLSNEGMEAVAKFYAARKKNDTPNQSVAKSIQLLVQNALFSLDKEGVFLEKGFGILEKTGLLGQFIRCVPVDAERCDQIVMMMLKCLDLVKKKLKSGTRTGDILDAVIAGKDGPINEKAKSSLARLQSLARLSNDNYDNMRGKNVRMCRHCDKAETPDGAKLMTCQRCKRIFYCSRECQVADWKVHKKTCTAQDSKWSGTVSHSAQKTFLKTVWAFVESNYFDIAKEVYKKTQEYNVPKKELLVEIDFHGDAPALRNEFKVWLRSGFLEGSSVADAPDWFRTHVDKKVLTRSLKEQYERVTSNDLLVACRAGNGSVNVQNLQFPVASTGCELLSDETVESIGREANYVRMVACMGQTNANKYFEKRSGLT
jgi:hypothetical protein